MSGTSEVLRKRRASRPTRRAQSPSVQTPPGTCCRRGGFAGIRQTSGR
jgi:hypothetical protein